MISTYYTKAFLLLVYGSLSVVTPLYAKGVFIVGSNDIKAGNRIDQAYVFNGMGCNGQNLSPELHWSNPPEGTKSFALTVYDPDAPTGSGFWHWIAYNIPSTVTNLPRGAAASPQLFTNVANDFGTLPYGGPCPPPGKPHRYVFTLHALKVEKLSPGEGATNAVVRFMMEAETLAKAKFSAIYGR